MIGHGHHFDKASTPKYSEQIGEMLSECLAWAYEGADRVWRWDGGDGVQHWAGGGEPYTQHPGHGRSRRRLPFPIDVEGALFDVARARSG